MEGGGHDGEIQKVSPDDLPKHPDESLLGAADVLLDILHWEFQSHQSLRRGLSARAGLLYLIVTLLALIVVSGILIRRNAINANPYFPTSVSTSGSNRGGRAGIHRQGAHPV